MRTKTILAVAGAVLAMLIVLVAGTGGDSDQARSPVVESTPAIASPPAAPLLTIDHSTLRRGSTLDQLLQDAGFETELRLNVLDRLSQAMDLRRIPAGAGLSVSRSAAGEPVAVAVRATADRFIRIGLPEEPAGSRFDRAPMPPLSTGAIFQSSGANSPNSSSPIPEAPCSTESSREIPVPSRALCAPTAAYF